MNKYLKLFKKIDFGEKINLYFDKLTQLKVNFASFKTIIVIYAIIFSVFLFLSMPGLYNYQNYIQSIKKQIFLDFKIKIDDISEAKYRFVPSPHIVIKDANVSFDKASNSEFAKLKDIKIFISLINLYTKDEISIKKLTVDKGNFYFKRKTFSYFQEHLKKAIIKPIKISNSNFFYLNEINDVANISPIKELDYFIDFKLKEKNLKIKGILFDVNYNFHWKKNYNNPNIIDSNITFKNPNISISNKSIKNFENNIHDGILKMIFLNNKININYKTHKDKINFVTDKNNLDSNYKIKFNGNITLNPFYFNTRVSLSNINYDFLIDRVLPYLYIYNNSIHSNINGIFELNLIDRNHKLLKDTDMKFIFVDKKILLENASINIKKIGVLNISKLEYLEKDNKIFVKSEMRMDIKDKRQFFSRFQVPKKNRIEIKEIYFDLEKNLDEKKYYISNINIDSLNESVKNKISFKYSDNEIYNMQTLTKLINEYLDEIN